MAKSKVKSTLGMLLAIGVFAAFFYGIYIFGFFFFNFGTNICYSGAIQDLTELSVSVANSNDISKKQTYTEMVKHLPLEGYETNCEELEPAIKLLTEKVNNASKN